VYDRLSKQIHLFKRGDRRKRLSATIINIEDSEVEEIIGKELYAKLIEDLEILDTIFTPPHLACIKEGSQSLLFFGSAMNNFGIEIFLQRFLQYAQSPMSRMANVSGGSIGNNAQDNAADTSINTSSETPENSSNTLSLSAQSPKPSHELEITPNYPEFTGFVFKLQANLNPKHRDRMAFVRICSGMYEKGMKVNHHRYKNKVITLSNAQSLFAQDRESIEIAYPGDIIGIHNPGCFAIGDTIYTGNQVISYPGIPSFSPEKFAFIRNLNPSAYKKFHKVSIIPCCILLTNLIVKNLKGTGRTVARRSGTNVTRTIEYR
jgi:peptide chain release factor 3